MDSASISAMLERTRSLVNSVSENVFQARQLREISRQMRAENMDFREFLSEQLVTALCKHQAWLEQRGEQA